MNMKLLSENQIRKMIKEDLIKQKVYFDNLINQIERKVFNLEEEIRAVKTGKVLI